MAKNNETTTGGPSGRASGIYARGVVVSSSARAFRKKADNSLLVKTTHELALQPGVIVLEQLLTPGETPGLQVSGDEVVEYPRLPEMHPVEIRAHGIREWKGKTIISGFDVLGADDSSSAT